MKILHVFFIKMFDLTHSRGWGRGNQIGARIGCSKSAVPNQFSSWMTSSDGRSVTGSPILCAKLARFFRSHFDDRIRSFHFHSLKLVSFDSYFILSMPVLYDHQPETLVESLRDGKLAWLNYEYVTNTDWFLFLLFYFIAQPLHPSLYFISLHFDFSIGRRDGMQFDGFVWREEKSWNIGCPRRDILR